MIPRFLLIRFPPRRPPHQLIPIFASVFGPEALDAADLVVLDFDRRVRLAHERVSQKIDAVTDVRRRGHHR